ncbi:centrosomal protein of 152 kDa [Xenopus laevis]|uniref:Centrosomal protein of 152 kDa n=1 Tax=Xenopus laevis TaxID=8355 RepID=CE152_XENLA|nr:centrosomal protein of 152 kDa [Xenopus laevis]Q498G2.1 RecName: Full=Centrosomal protein of 152 kDa; Short=Cep152 [Xenopus laevis]AAI00230.1 LOC446951 protein [Xenopus laevis]
MSIDFDSGALQTQQEDEEYDKEDYAREQELQQLLTDLPHDMLDDSLSSSPEPSYSDCSGHEISEKIPQWEHGANWGNDDLPNHQKPYKNGFTENQYCMGFVGKQDEHLRNQAGRDKMSNGWDVLHANEDDPMFNGKYRYSKDHAYNSESNGQAFHGGDHYDAPGHCSSSELYHLPDDFQPYTNCQQVEHFPDSKKEHFQGFAVPEETSKISTEPFQVKYNPYQIKVARMDEMNQDPERRDGNFDDLQREFLDTGENSTGNMQFVQLQVLYKARGRQLEEQNNKLEESERQIRYLNHQLAIVKDQKDGLTISLQESQSLLQNSREMEIQLKGQLTALEKTVESLTTNEEQLRKELNISKVAMESFQQQLLDLRRSESIQRAREQHETVVSMLKKKHEEQVLALQQKLDDVNAMLNEEKELCSRLETRLKLSERKEAESKLEKTDIINRLSKSLEESQKQCANLLQSGSIQEATQLRLQLQQVQSSKIINDGMNKALQEEVRELQEQITMYESAARLGAFVNSGEEQQLSDSYVELGIKNFNWQKSRLGRIVANNGVKNDLSSEEIILELKTELERCLNSNKTKRKQIVQLQAELKGHLLKNEELKKSMEIAERTARDSQIQAENLANKVNNSPFYSSSSDRFREEIQKLQSEKQILQQENEKHLLFIKEFTVNEEKLKASNQELCNEMRGMIQDFDQDKKEAIERCERTYEQHNEDIKAHLLNELYEKFESEKELLSQGYEEKITLLQAQMNEIHREMAAVQECYIAVCKEKDALEENMREHFKKELQKSEEEVTAKAIQDVEMEWAQKLNQALQDAKTKSLQSFETQTIQTDESSLAKSDLNSDCIDELKVKLQNAIQEKEKAVHQAQLELEERHHEETSKQVEVALTRAYGRWLQELTSLPEYKARLKLEQEKWEKTNERNVERQVSDALYAAEIKWKMRSDKVDFTVRQKEFEEKIASMKRELELKAEESQALLKAEIATSRAQWNKEKHDEIQRLREDNEKDYRVFLDEHRNKLTDTLSTAKVEFEKQKNELIAQKDREMAERLDESLKQWALDESRRMRALENEILSEVEQCMYEIHDQLLDKSIVKDRLPSMKSNLDVTFLEKLKACLQKSVKGILYKVLANARQDWKKKYDTESNQETGIRGGELEGSDDRKTAKMWYLDKDLGKTEKQPCCEHWVQQLEKSKKECYEIRSKLEKACRHLQQLVKEQKLKAEKYRKNHILTEELKKQNSELQKKLELTVAPSPACLEPVEGGSNGCMMCNGNALEEIRAQYIKAVDKIKNDMLRYIHESKGRAAELLKSEVLRERQETARKMRKYYLTCLQQLLKDDGNNEGAEKKIINAASKLATMAKVLETPVSQKYQSKSLNSDLPQNENFLSETTQDQRSLQKPAHSHQNNNPLNQNIDQQTIEELIKRHVREKSDGNKVTDAEGASAINENSSFPTLRKSLVDNGNSQFVPSAPFQKLKTFSCIDSSTEGVLVTHQNKQSALQSGTLYPNSEHPKKKPGLQRFDLQETPVRDENGSNDWSCISSKSLFQPHSAKGSLTQLKMGPQNADVEEHSSAVASCSLAEENHNTFSSGARNQHFFAQVAKRKDENSGRKYSNKIQEPSATGIHPESKLFSDVGQGNKLPSRKLLLDFTLSPQQDSGFDSPFPNLNNFN